ncbi:hypothetical protein [Okeania sp. SIO2C9]|uniref:hypothetical protein n=1 Tax=Okeania sp. SIO2C9 TaxID=2607791 RepID=UPI0025FE8896|nr:hypothetical protein [Okeania sp. SIO2C9]
MLKDKNIDYPRQICTKCLDIKPHEFAERLGVSVKTLQRWDKCEKLKTKRV